jgi:hypothetical protein
MEQRKKKFGKGETAKKEEEKRYQVRGAMLN